MNQALFTKLQQYKQEDLKTFKKADYAGFWQSVVDKYPDQAHFVYEFIQNADDAQASWINFDLEDDGVWVKHNGKERFTITDPDTHDEDKENGRLGHINALLGVGMSSKVNSPKIGKFGVGFKSIFDFTEEPHVYDEINFKITDYIYPENISAIKKPIDETWFWIPFKADRKTGKHDQILNRLKALRFPLLFIDSLEKLNWRCDGHSGSFELKPAAEKEEKVEIVTAIPAEYLKHIKIYNNRRETIPLIKLSKSVIIQDKTYSVSIVYELNSAGRIETGLPYDAYCFFPTEKKTDQSFMVHAPFLLTDNRANIKNDPDGINKLFAEALGDLVVESLDILKNTKDDTGKLLLGDDILDVMPLYPDDSEDQFTFNPIVEKVKKALSSNLNDYLPGRNSYFPRYRSYWPANPELNELFDDNQISQLFKVDNAGFVFCSTGFKSMNRSDREREKYVQELVEDTVDIKKALRRIDSAFIESQSIEWLKKLYRFIAERPFLYAENDKEKLPKKLPLFLTNENKAIKAFTENLAEPNIFLPELAIEGQNVIHADLLDDDIKKWLESFGIGKSDPQAYLNNTIFNRYGSGEEIDLDNAIEDCKILFKYIKSHGEESVNKMIERFQSLNMLPCVKNNLNSINYFSKVFFQNGHLDIYFGENNYSIVHPDLLEYKDELMRLGVSNQPRLMPFLPTVNYENRKERGLDKITITSNNERRNKILIVDYKLEGFEEFVSRLNFEIEKKELSLIFWKIIQEIISNSDFNHETVFGVFIFYEKHAQSQTQRRFTAEVFKELKNLKWIIDSFGVLKSPSEITIEDLHEIYEYDKYDKEKIKDILGFKDGISEKLNKEELEYYNLSKELQSFFSREELEKLIESKKNKIVEVPKEGKMKEPRNLSEINEDQKNVSNEIEELIVKKEELYYDQINLDIEKKIEAERKRNQNEEEKIRRLQELEKIIIESEKYSFGWFKALLELEHGATLETSTFQQTINLRFERLSKQKGSDSIILLEQPSSPIPQRIEDLGNIYLRFFNKNDEIGTVRLETVSVKDFTLKAVVAIDEKLKLNEILTRRYTHTQISISDPNFLLQELKTSFGRMDFQDTDNLKKLLPKSLHFIFGPPGTGKTTHIARNILFGRAKEKKLGRTLVLAPTNKAADVLVSKVMDISDDKNWRDWLFRFVASQDSRVEQEVLVNRDFDIKNKETYALVSTIARYSYDYFFLTKSSKLHLSNMSFDTVIIDEASMVGIAAITHIIHNNPNAEIIIAGDPFQIAPIVHVNHWQDENIYKMVNLTSFKNQVTEPHKFKITNLPTQYRSLPSIGDLYSRLTYSGMLKHHREDIDDKMLDLGGIKLNLINIITYNNSNYSSLTKPKRLNKSPYQIYSAIFSFELLQIIAKKSVGEKPIKIGVICPYRAQATMVQKLVERLEDQHKNVTINVGTIHGFQGDECDIVIVIFNSSNPISSHPNMFLNKLNIINVAISRAQDRLIIIMPNKDTIGIENLRHINNLRSLAKEHHPTCFAEFKSEVIEKYLWNSEKYIEDNTFATGHHDVNVYAKAAHKYEVRAEDTALDVQLNTN